MIEKIISIFQNISYFHMNTLFVLGLALFGGTIGGRLFQKMKIPQVVGYIIIGIILGQSGFKIIDGATVRTLQPFNYFALGLIGFMIGGELKKDVFKKYGKQFILILLFEGLFSFIFVALFISVAGYFLFHDKELAIGLGLLLGAISSATAPAATTDVLWEYKAKGPLTTTVFGIVALDDALALMLFAVASSIASRIFGTVHESIFMAFVHPIYEIGGAVFVGGASGFLLVRILRHYNQKGKVLVFLVGIVLFVLGLSLATNVSMILAAMVLGLVVSNGLPEMSKQVFSLVEEFTPPIFILFFVLIGAKLDISNLNLVLAGCVVVYLIGRTSGKMIGSFLGARISGAEETVRNNLPLCLFSQAGVAIGLSIVAAHMLPENIGNMIIIIITVSTFVVQLIGPSCVKLAITRAGEIGKNITEQDLICTINVEDLLDASYPIIKNSTPIQAILNVFSDSPYTQYPVADDNGKLSGVINIESIKDSLQFGGDASFLLGFDIKKPFEHSIKKSASLYDAKQYMDKRRLGFLPVVDDMGSIVGCFDRRMYQNFVSRKLLENS
ncbi:MAG: cation:proton antiporter [Candidatus Zapsychrus exili]|nr:cation:proton antiporter [Candidatus Zapsychrus exili]